MLYLNFVFRLSDYVSFNSIKRYTLFGLVLRANQPEQYVIKSYTKGFLVKIVSDEMLL